MAVTRQAYGKYVPSHYVLFRPRKLVGEGEVWY